MTASKRILDVTFALLLLVVLSPVIVILLIWIWLKQGRPIFFVAERMKGVDDPFNLWKLRTMEVVDTDTGVSGGDKDNRITPVGAKLRSKRLDELPQLWNIIRGDLSFVGPRPPLRQYVEEFPELYAEVLKSRPGVTGLATLVFHQHEEWLLKDCKTPEETHDVYARRCVPRKARIDLIYQKNRSLAFDFGLVFQTIGNLARRGR